MTQKTKHTIYDSLPKDAKTPWLIAMLIAIWPYGLSQIIKHKTHWLQQPKTAIPIVLYIIMTTAIIGYASTTAIPVTSAEQKYGTIIQNPITTKNINHLTTPYEQ